jgi:hypothetical protein
MAAMLLSVRSVRMRKVDGRQTLAAKPGGQPIDVAAWSDSFTPPEIAPEGTGRHNDPEGAERALAEYGDRKHLAKRPKARMTLLKAPRGCGRSFGRKEMKIC